MKSDDDVRMISAEAPALFCASPGAARARDAASDLLPPAASIASLDAPRTSAAKACELFLLDMMIR